MGAYHAGSVLIIEDDVLIAFCLAQVVTAGGRAVIGPATTKPQAVALAERTPPDLILSDVTLERHADGVEAVKDILAQRPAPVIFVTGTPEAVSREGPLAEAVVLAKPVPVDTLHRTIEHVLNGHGSARP